MDPARYDAVVSESHHLIWSALKPSPRPQSVLVLPGYDDFERRFSDGCALRRHRCFRLDGERVTARVEADDTNATTIETILVPPAIGELSLPGECQLLAERSWQRALALIEKLGAKRCVLVSSLSAIGPRYSAVPNLFEGDDEAPTTELGRAHLWVETAAMEARNRLGFELVILRPAAIYSEEDPSVFNELFSALRDDPQGLMARWADLSLQILHVDDLVRALCFAIDRGDWIYHLSDHTPRTLGEQATPLYDAALRLGIALAPPSGDLALVARETLCHFPFPDHRARRELEFEPLRLLSECAEEVVRSLAKPPELDAETWAERLKGEWESRAQSPNRDFYVASHLNWKKEESWRRQAKIDASFVLDSLDVDAMKSSSVLDLGCGVGRLVPEIAPLAKDYTGIDIAPSMIEEARARSANFANARFFVSEGHRVPDEARDRKYDLIFALAVFIHCPKEITRALIRDGYHLLAPGGIYRLMALADPTDLKGIENFENARALSDQTLEVAELGTPADSDEHVTQAYYHGGEFGYDEFAAILEELGAEFDMVRNDPYQIGASIKRSHGT